MILVKNKSHAHNYTIYLALAFILYLVASYFNIGHNTPDEYFQIFETAMYKLNYISFDRLPWELHDAMRPALQTFMVVAVYKLCAMFAEPNPFVISFIIRVFSALLSLFSTIIFIKAFIDDLEQPKYKSWFIILALFNPITVYTSVHFNSENIAGHLFLLLISLVKLNVQFNKKFLGGLCSGVLISLIFTIRFQMGFAVLGLVAWLLFFTKTNFKFLFALIISFVIGMAIFNLYIDYWFYQKFVVTAYNYVYQNLVLHKVDSFGNSPWYSYFLLVLAFAPYGPIYLCAYCLFVYKQPKNILVWVSIPFLIIHMLIGHKELRFLMPLLYITPFFVIWAIEYIIRKRYIAITKLDKICKPLWFISLLGYLMLLVPVSTELGAWKFIYANYKQPTVYYYTHNSDWISLFYVRHNVTFIPVDNIAQVNCPANVNCLYGIAAANDKHDESAKLVYNFLPNWLESITVLSRSISHINVYELHNVEAEQ